jgi:hypothetical protein
VAWWVINEWLLEDLRGANGAERQRQTVEFLSKLVKRCDGIVVVRGSAWWRKAFDLMKRSDDPAVREASKFLHLQVLRDSQKCRQLSQENLCPLPCALRQIVKPDDWYLVQAYLTAKADAIITTDGSLKEVLSSHNLPVLLRGEAIEGEVRQADGGVRAI